MTGAYQGSLADFLTRIITAGTEPVTLISPKLPSPSLLDQILILTKQYGRTLRIVSPLYDDDPTRSAHQLKEMLRLTELGAKIKNAERGALPSMLLSPPFACAFIPSPLGLPDPFGGHVIILEGEEAREILALGEKIWRHAGVSLSQRSIKTALKWLELIVDVYEEGKGEEEELVLDHAELTLFNKRRGQRQKREKKEAKSWWTFHGTSEERVNPFLPVQAWALQLQAHKRIWFPAGKRPTGVRTGDWVFFAILSREVRGDAEIYIVGKAQALAYRPLIDDASKESREKDEYLARYPHALRVEKAEFIRGAIGEGVTAYSIMNELGAEIFESTYKNKQKGSGNIDPHKSIAQKSLILLSKQGAEKTHKELEIKLARLGKVSGDELAMCERE